VAGLTSSYRAHCHTDPAPHRCALAPSGLVLRAPRRARVRRRAACRAPGAKTARAHTRCTAAVSCRRCRCCLADR
jgi:hypothetical protein